MTGILQDLRYAIRQLRKNPGFATIAVITLALGIGANTAIFSVVHAVLLRPLPFPEPTRLVLTYEGIPKIGFPKLPFSAPDLLLYRQAQHSFEDMADYQNRDFELSGAGEPERATGARISANLFSVLGVHPMLGRAFAADEDQPGRNVVLISYALWQSKYGGSHDVIGRAMNVDRAPYTIIGVMPRHFQFPLPGDAFNSDPAAFWLPMAFTPNELQGWGKFYMFNFVARLKPGVALDQARAEADILARRITQAYPVGLRQQFGNPELAFQVVPMRQELIGDVRPLLLVLQATVAAVLLIACVNVGLLLLSRASGRSREIAVRSALGASRNRLMAQLLCESLILAVPGGILGLILALWSKKSLLQYLPPGIALPHEIALNGTVLVFTVGTTLFTAILFGFVPAIETTRSQLGSTLQEGGRGSTIGRERHRLQGVFVVVEFALALVLMVGAGLLLRSFGGLLKTNPGFRPESVLAMNVSLPKQAYPHIAEIRIYHQRAVEQLSQMPGVISAAASTDLPLHGFFRSAVLIEGPEGNKRNMPAVLSSWIIGDYLKTMGIPLLRGRSLTAEDRPGTQPVALINQGMAQQLWPNEDALGKRIFAVGAWSTVVGIVGDVHDGALSATPTPHVYRPYLQIFGEPDAPDEGLVETARRLNFVVRTQGDPAAASAAAVNQLHSLDPALAVVDVRTMRSEIQESVAPQRFNAALVGIYAGLALLLAVIGIYGVLAYMVTQQIHEIGIRIALGAQRRDMLAHVLLRGARLVSIGAAIGLPVAAVVTRLMASLLYGVSPRDPVTFFGVSVVLVVAAMLACYVPALRATRVDPMVALRHE